MLFLGVHCGIDTSISAPWDRSIVSLISPIRTLGVDIVDRVGVQHPTAFTAMVGYRLFDVVKYSINAGITATPMAVAMNKKTWNSLPPDVKKILDNMKMRYAFECSTKYDADVKKALALGKSKGKVIYPLPAAELAKWEKKLAPVYDRWKTDMKAKGLPGDEVLGKIRQLQGK